MKSKQSLFAILLLLASIGQVTADLYLPSLPAISSGLATSINNVQWSVSLYMWGFAISQLIYGPLSDGIGRKQPLLIGLSLVLVGSIICISAQSIGWLIAGRFIQGIGTGSGVVLSRSILRDVYSGNSLAKYFSYLSLAGIPIMAGAPLMGGIIQHALGWRANFVFLTLYAIMALLIVFVALPETNLHRDKQHLQWNQIKLNFLTLLKNPVFISLSFIIFLTYAGILAWMTAGPVLLQIQAGLTPIQFGCVMLITGAAFATGLLINGRLVSRYGMRRMLSVGLSLMLLGALSMLTLSIIIKSVGVIVLVAPMAIFFAGTSFMFTNAYASALGPFSKIAGIAGSLFSFMQIAGGAASSGIMAHLHQQTQRPLALLICAVAVIALSTFLCIKDKIAVTR